MFSDSQRWGNVPDSPWEFCWSSGGLGGGGRRHLRLRLCFSPQLCWVQSKQAWIQIYSFSQMVSWNRYLWTSRVHDAWMTHREFTFVKFQIFPASDRSLERVSSTGCSWCQRQRSPAAASCYRRSLYSCQWTPILQNPIALRKGNTSIRFSFQIGRSKETRNIFVTWLSNLNVKMDPNILITMTACTSFKCFSHSVHTLDALLLLTAGSTPV